MTRDDFMSSLSSPERELLDSDQSIYDTISTIPALYEKTPTWHESTQQSLFRSISEDCLRRTNTSPWEVASFYLMLDKAGLSMKEFEDLIVYGRTQNRPYFNDADGLPSREWHQAVDKYTIFAYRLLSWHVFDDKVLMLARRAYGEEEVIKAIYAWIENTKTRSLFDFTKFLEIWSEFNKYPADWTLDLIVDSLEGVSDDN